MLETLRHLLDPNYLYALELEPPGSWPRGTIWWALALMCVIALCLIRAHVGKRKIVFIDLLAILCASLGLIWLALRPWLTGPFSARIWPYSLTACALVAALASRDMRRVKPAPDGPVARSLGLCLRPHDPSLSWPKGLGHAFGHLLGMGWLIMRSPDSFWLSALALGVLSATWLLPALGSRRAQRPLRIELLAPLYLAYLAHGLAWLLEVALGVNIGAYAAYQYPDLWSPWFNSETMVLLAAAWVTLTALSYLGHLLPNDHAGFRSVALALLAPCLAIGWYLLVVIRHLSDGVTGSDPYCYLQMASDLVHTGSALHAFPLAELASQAGLPTWPTAHVGYHAPAVSIWAPTVWPIGWPVMLAPLVWLGGERLAMWGAPLCALASAGIVWRLAKHLVPDKHARLVGGLAAAITLTSIEATLRSLVPMADAAAQLCTVAMVYALVRGQRSKGLLWDALAGMSLGMAYWVRHPLLWLGLGALVWYAPRLRTRQGWHQVCTFGLAALLVAVPDLVYHARHFGAVWHTESPEWFLISGANILPTLAAMLRDGLLLRSELGYLWPMIALGLWAHAHERHQRATFGLMLVSLLAALAFALSYSALRWRDLIALLPIFALWAAWGMAVVWRKAQGSGRLRAAALGILLLLLAARGTVTARLPWDAHVWTFGSVSPAQRAALGELASCLPDKAIVATGLNSGAVERYTGHNTIRPATWTKEQFALFCHAAEQNGMSLYILDDGEEINLWLERQTLALDPMCMLDLSSMGLGGQPCWPQPATLYRLNKATP